jgi:hypothetical protein
MTEQQSFYKQVFDVILDEIKDNTWFKDVIINLKLLDPNKLKKNWKDDKGNITNAGMVYCLNKQDKLKQLISKYLIEVVDMKSLDGVCPHIINWTKEVYSGYLEYFNLTYDIKVHDIIVLLHEIGHIEYTQKFLQYIAIDDEFVHPSKVYAFDAMLDANIFLLFSPGDLSRSGAIDLNRTVKPTEIYAEKFVYEMFPMVLAKLKEQNLI